MMTVSATSKVTVTDIFHEVNEEVRRDQFKKLWDRYGILVIVAAFLVVAGVGGWRGLSMVAGHQGRRGCAAYDVASDLDEQGKISDAEAAFAKLATNGTAGYRLLARLRAAAAESDPKASVAAYDAIAKDSSVDKTLQDLAGIRAGLILVDSAPLTEMMQRLVPLAQPKGAFRHTARELLALASVKAGDTVAAKRWFDEILGDAETPQSVRARIDVLMTLNDGGKG